MVYLTRIRQEQDSVFGAFDCPSGNQVMPRRSRSNTPLQALNLFNSNFVLQQAGLFAGRLRREAGDQPGAQARRAFQLMCARDPDRFEGEASTAMIREEGLEAFCRGLYNTSEFLFCFLTPLPMPNPEKNIPSWNRRAFLSHSATAREWMRCSSCFLRATVCWPRKPGDWLRSGPKIDPANLNAARPSHFSPRATQVLMIFSCGWLQPPRHV